MKPILTVGIIIVNLALIFYTIGFLKLSKEKILSRIVFTFFSIGVFFDLTSTICMVIGSSQGAITLHGLIGYSSLTGMLIETILCLRFIQTNGTDKIISPRFFRGTMFVYIYWVLAYITGAILIMIRH